MPKIKLMFALAWLLVCGFAAKSFASGTNEFNSWNTDDNQLLPQSSVIALTQTRDGYLWIGTMKGLARFDGIRAEVFDDLGSATIVNLFEDGRGGLWVGTEKSGVLLIRDGRATPQNLGPGGPQSRLVSTCEDAKGAVWLMTADNGLYRVFGTNVEPMRVAENQMLAYRSVIAEKNGSVWVATATNRQSSTGAPLTIARLRRIDPGSVFDSEGRLQLTSEPVTNLNFMFTSSHGGHWRLVNGQIEKWNNDKLERVLGPYRWNQEYTPVTSACEDADGSLFIATLGDGVYQYESSGRVTHITSPDTLNHATVLSLCRDREGSLWVGTDGGGANRVRRQKFELQPETIGNTVQIVCEDLQGGLWYGFNDDELKLWKDGTLKVFGPSQGLLVANIRAVLVDQNQTVWVGGLSRGSSGGGIFQLVDGRFRFAPGTEGARPQVSVIFEDRATNIWVGMEQGLARWDGRGWKVFTTQDGLSANAVQTLAEDAQGNLWIGTDGGGLNRFRNGKFDVYRASVAGLPGDSISALYADADGAVWIGTPGNGLARFRDGHWKRFAKRDGLAGNSIAYLIEDTEGFLWIGSNEGLMRVEKKALAEFSPGRTNAIQVRTFRKADGLPTKECTSGSSPAAWRTREGKLWFAMTKGLVGVNPSKLWLNTNPPPVVIESVLVDDEPQSTNLFQVNWSRDIVVSPSKELVEIHFTSLNLAAPERARFRYRLEGHETKWTETGEMREARYQKLPHGRYRFQVTACNEDGIWNLRPASLFIVVEPPFWKTAWFQTVASVCLLGVIIGTVYFISTQKLQRQLVLMRQQEALEKERSRIARDLHDQLGANLTQVALLGEMAEEDKHSPGEIESYAKQICSTARETSRALDEIVWAANPSNDTLEGLVNYACKYAQDYFALAGLRYRLDVPNVLPVTNVPPDLRHNVFLAFKETVNNVVKHAKASEARIRLRLDGDRFTLEVEDDGRGVPADALNKGRNGLRNMRKRMEDVGGAFEMEPGKERGTIVRLIAPIGKSRREN